MNDESLSLDFLTSDISDNFEQDGRLSILENEIGLISDPKIGSFVRFVLSKSEPFWVAPVSGDDKNFPPDEYEEGGLVLHTVRSIRAFLLMEPTLELTVTERNCALAAILLRNCTKAVFVDDQIMFDPFHLYTVDAFVEHHLANTVKNAEDIGPILGMLPEDLGLIMILIHSSNGYLTPIPETFPKSFLQKAVHFSDLMAAAAYDILYLGDPNLDGKD